MKKLLVVVMTIAIVISMCACLASEVPEVSTAAETTTTGEAQPAPDAAAVPVDKAEILVGISMPTHSDESWIRHANFTMENLEKLGYSQFDVQWAEDVVEAQVSQIENMITKGADVLVIAAVDGEALTDVIQKAADQGIPVIAYDRLIRNTKNISCYITFDNFKVGVAEAEYIVDKLGLADGKGPFNIELFGGSSDDNNSFFFYDGAMSILNPYIESGMLVVKSGQMGMEKVATPGWAASAAQSRMDNLLTANYADGSRVDAVLSPYDGLSLGIISSLKNTGYGTADLPLPIVTGQDAEVASVISILMGEQSQTVWKDFRVPGEKCAQMIDALVQGTEVPINDTTTYDNGAFVVPAYLCEVTAVDLSNVKELFDSGFYKIEDSTWDDVRDFLK
jgi:putative multiple sugar transport system substrate-binding protein